MPTTKSESDSKSSDSKYGPVREVEVDDHVYDVVPLIRTPRVDPGETIRIGVYIAGYGSIPRSKLNVFHHHPELLDEDNPGEIDHGVSGKIDIENNEILDIGTGPGGGYSELDTRGVTVGLSEASFADDSKWGPDDPEKREQYLPRIMAEGTWKDVAPIELCFKTDEDASPGDYNIQLAFTTIVGDSVEQSIVKCTIHVNSFQERWEVAWTSAKFAVVAIGLLSLTYQAGILSSFMDILTNIVGWLYPLTGSEYVTWNAVSLL